jgi:hypothetical protein
MIFTQVPKEGKIKRMRFMKNLNKKFALTSYLKSQLIKQ